TRAVYTGPPTNSPHLWKAPNLVQCLMCFLSLSLSLPFLAVCFFGGGCVCGGLTGNLRGFNVATAPVLQQFFPQATRHSLLGPPPVSLKPPQLGFPPCNPCCSLLRSSPSWPFFALPEARGKPPEPEEGEMAPRCGAGGQLSHTHHGYIYPATGQKKPLAVASCPIPISANARGGQNSCPDVAGLGTSSLPARPRGLSRAPLPFAPLCQVLSNAGALKVTIQQSSESRAISTTPAIKPGPSGPPLPAPPGAALNYFCYVCRTNCSNQQSFQAHLSGEPHQQRLQEVQERSKVCLVPKQLPLGKESQRWCNTCQVNFSGDLIKHRRTQEHKLAKRFLRPFCTVCSRYFKTPRKFVEHMKSLEHKQKNREVRLGEKDLGGPEDSEELITVDAVGCFEEQDEDEDEEEEEAGEGPQLDPRETSVEDPGGNAEYCPDTVYGLDFLVPVAGFLCRLCHKFYSSDSATRLTHCKSRMHFENLQVSPSFFSLFLPSLFLPPLSLSSSTVPYSSPSLPFSLLRLP
uniref:Matrin-type domain-containing protein n=1 Tax=Pseudonaja textilis TaxID=8673 RepID=A0A670YY20_PSETE